MSNYKENVNAFRVIPDTARFMYKWTEEEDSKLMEQAIAGIDPVDIAKKHQRTIGSIKSRIMKNALNMMKEKDLPLEYVASLIHISAEDFDNYKQREEKRSITPKIASKVKKPQEIDTVPYDKFMGILTEIRDYLKIIAEK